MRAFVVGNGPSLNNTPLDKLKGEVSFAVNRISKIYDRTDWRPTHYVRAEEAGMDDPETYLEDMRLHIDGLKCETWCNLFFVKRGEFKKTPHIIKPCAHYATDFDNPNCPHLWHLPILCTFGSSVNVAIQIAASSGYNPIYLVGCDLGYKNSNSHFDANYESGLHTQPARMANLNIHEAHVIAKRSHDGIYNATIGGELEVYERVDFARLF